MRSVAEINTRSLKNNFKGHKHVIRNILGGSNAYYLHLLKIQSVCAYTDMHMHAHTYKNLIKNIYFDERHRNSVFHHRKTVPIKLGSAYPTYASKS